MVDVLRRHTEVLDYGNVTLPGPSPARDPRSQVIDPDGLGALVARFRDAVAPILDNEHLPLIIGGDCPFLGMDSVLALSFFGWLLALAIAITLVVGLVLLLAPTGFFGGCDFDP